MKKWLGVLNRKGELTNEQMKQVKFKKKKTTTNDFDHHKVWRQGSTWSVCKCLVVNLRIIVHFVIFFLLSMSKKLLFYFFSVQRITKNVKKNVKKILSCCNVSTERLYADDIVYFAVIIIKMNELISNFGFVFYFVCDKEVDMGALWSGDKRSKVNYLCFFYSYFYTTMTALAAMQYKCTVSCMQHFHNLLWLVWTS